MQTWIEKQEIFILAISRHYSQVNEKLFEVGLLDTLLQMQQPSKEQRHLVLDFLIKEEFG